MKLSRGGRAWISNWNFVCKKKRNKSVEWNRVFGSFGGWRTKGHNRFCWIRPIFFLFSAIRYERRSILSSRLDIYWFDWALVGQSVVSYLGDKVRPRIEISIGGIFPKKMLICHFGEGCCWKVRRKKINARCGERSFFIENERKTKNVEHLETVRCR